MTLGIVVFIHELGHFLVAIKRGITVEIFSIGFGPKIFSFKRKDTEYRIACIPFGGYVKFLGDEIESLEEGKPPIPGGFFASSPVSRIYTAFAGPAVNLLFGLLLYCIVFFVGRPAAPAELSTEIGYIQPDSPAFLAGLKPGDQILSIAGKDIHKWMDVLEEIALSKHAIMDFKIQRSEQILNISVEAKVDPQIGIKKIGVSVWDHVIVGQVHENMPAQKAGLLEDDEILAINNVPIYSWERLVEEISKNGQTEISLDILRKNEKIKIIMNPLQDKNTNRLVIGIEPKFNLKTIHPNPFDLFFHDVYQIFKTLNALIFGSVSTKGLAGPVGILQVMGAYAELGFINYLLILAMISINLGVLNILPIPVLDGGHILFSLIELARKKALRKKTIMVFQNIFVSLLIGMILFVTYNDIIRIKNKLKSQKTQSAEIKNEMD